MSSQTSGNLKLTKPTYGENADVAVINSNMDKIDTNFTSLNSELTGYIYGGRLANGTDLNTVITPGHYFLSSTFSFVNAPATLSTLIVQKGASDSTAVLQIGINTTQVWFRYRTNATNWDSWRPITPSLGWLPSGTDIDTIITPGVYGISSSNTFTGLPDGIVSGLLEVISPNLAGSYATQRLTSFSGTYVWMRYRGQNSGAGWGGWIELVAIRTPTAPTYDTTKVNSSSSTYYINVRRVGKIVSLSGGFVASANISVSTPTTIATGLPKSLSTAMASMVAINATKKQPVALCVSTTGNLQTYYSGETIASGDTVRFSTTYFTNDP